MSKRVLIISWISSGGIARVVNDLAFGLMKEGFQVRTCIYKYGFSGSSIFDLLKAVSEHDNSDAVIFTGSIPLLSVKYRKILNSSIFLFVHGFVLQEKVNSIARNKNINNLYGQTVQISSFLINKKINIIDNYICHSLITCEVNDIPSNRMIILPQFIFINDYKKYYKKLINLFKKIVDKKFDAVIYTSFADSPRLLDMDTVLRLFNRVGRRINRKISILLVSPKNTFRETSLSFLNIYSTGFLHRVLFHKNLINSKLYFSIVVDEELSYTSVEAGALGVPVAKLTAKSRMMYADYTKDEVITSSSLRDLELILTEYYTSTDYYMSYYSKNVQRFIIRERTWKEVSNELVRKLKKS